MASSTTTSTTTTNCASASALVSSDNNCAAAAAATPRGNSVPISNGSASAANPNNNALRLRTVADTTSITSAKSSSNSRCVDLALEGERLCRADDPKTGVQYFEAALTAGTDDLATLSAIYSQLGNAYFFMADYVKALEYHRHDLTLARTIGDRAGEAKASGNLGNTLKVLGRFDEAIVCCQRHLDITRELHDKIGESRALYNLGNAYHAKGKHIGGISNYEAGEYPQEVRNCLQKAVEYYEKNLRLVQELNDKTAEGRSCGNLGNTLYLLGDFRQAVHYHLQRLTIAKQFGDKQGMRRAYSNLGNAHIFLGEFEQAIECYKQALAIAIELGESATEAQACYSLGNTATLLGEHEQAIEYYVRHMTIARQLCDQVGQARSAWSLGNAFMSLGQHSKSLYFAMLHMQLSAKIGDLNGESIAEQNLSDLSQILGPNAPPDSSADPAPVDIDKSFIDSRRSRRRSFERLESTRCLTPQMLTSSNFRVNNNGSRSLGIPNSETRRSSMLSVNQVQPSFSNTPEDLLDDDTFFEYLSRAQSKRMDDQRCDPKAIAENMVNRPRIRASDAPRDSLIREQGPDEFLDLVIGIQSRRMDDQRALLPELPGLQHPAQVLGPHLLMHHQQHQLHFLEENGTTTAGTAALVSSSNNGTTIDSANNVVVEQTSNGQQSNGDRPPCQQLEDDFIDMLIRCQSTRIDEQRSELPKISKGITVPDDDFFQLVLKMQARRFEEQRANLVGSEDHSNNLAQSENVDSSTEPKDNNAAT